MRGFDAPAQTGRIFDIRRFSTHDGGGIRTTIFLKGCPLSCAWCHNPEGISSEKRPIWFQSKCVHCGVCEGLARHGGVVRTDSGVVLDPQRDEDWDAVTDACPSGALCWDSRDYTVDEVMEQVLRDRPFYAHGGGGITLSGGDPLAQGGFSLALLRRCKEERLHTAMETELHAKSGVLSGVVPYLDLVYADLKLMDSAAHKRFTGVENGCILANLRALLIGEHRRKVIVRTPLIPGITATGENIAAISRFITGLYPEVRYELLNYNPLAAAKYPLVGRSFCLPQTLRKFSREELAGFSKTALENGVLNLILE